MNTKTFSITVSKWIGAILIMIFSLAAVSYAQNCILPMGRSPSTLTDGQSKTGYSIAEATYTQSCTWSKALVTCISWSIANINTYKYPSCIPHTWANCTTPTGANHLEYKILYKSLTNTYTQTCQQLSQNLQCLNGVFTWGITPSLYQYRKCTDQARMQCLDVWTNTIKDHGETIIGYTANTPWPWQTCNTLKKTLTCTNSTRSGNGTAGQAGLVSGCIQTGTYAWCLNIWTNQMTAHGYQLPAYTAPSGICTGLLTPLTCINGQRSWGNQLSLYSGCTPVGQTPCANIISGSGTLPHGTYVTKYTQPHAFAALNESCNAFSHLLQCTNGTRSGNIGALYTGCQNVASGSCPNIRGSYVPHMQFIYGYTSNTPTASLWCESVKIKLTCTNSSRYTTWGIVTSQAGLYPSCGGCVLPRWAPLAEGTQIWAYSSTGVEYPKSCNDFSTILSCSGGILNGNRQTYKYPGCTDIGGLVAGVDIAINESPVRSGYLIAQGSSPELSILFKNKGDTPVNGTNLAAAFLTCVWKAQGGDINVYSSNILEQFILDAWTKVGVNIRIKPIFTQALGTKIMVCSINPGLVGITDVTSTNNTRSGTFEIVEARRFDLALSRSIEGVNQNLEAAEGAIGTQGLQNFLFNKIMNVLVPLIIIIGILSAILGFYKLMFSSDENAVKEGTRYIVFGIVGIIVIMSAKFIGQNVYDMLTTGEIVGTNIATWLYDRIIYPFIKFAIYLVLGAMFVILVSRVITFLFGSDSDAQKKAWTLIGRNVISMFIIIGAKQIVQAIYGKQSDVINPNGITNLWEIWSGILDDKNIPILYQIINYALGIASLVILVIIIIQTVKLLTKPDDPAQIKNIKNSLFYMLLWILVLGTGYLIVNFAIIN